MTLFKRTALVAAMMPLFASSSWGLGLGDITMKSYLNEPLRAEVELLDVQNLSADDIRIRLATQDDFDRVGIDRAYFLTNVRFEVVVNQNGGKILLSTDQPLLEPYLDFLIETRWPAGRMLREYTVLVDLPTPVEAVPVTASASRLDQQLSADSAATTSDVSKSPSEQTSAAVGRPDRDYDRDAAERPVAGGSYLVQANDTLWEIASAARPPGKTVEQTMIAALNMNGDAFAGGNINGLKAGYVLELPGEDDVLTGSSEAVNAVASQNRDWANGVRRTRALRVVADNETEDDVEPADALASAEAASGYDSFADADESKTPATQLPSIDGGASDLAAQLPAVDDREGPVASNPELAAIQARLSQLSDQVGSLRQLVSVKDQQIAALQAEIAARDEKAALDAQAASVPQTPMVASEAPVQDSGLPWWVFALGGVVFIALGGVIYARRADQRAQLQSASSGLTASQRNPVARKEPVSSAAGGAAAPLAAAKADEDGERGYGRDLHNDYAEENAVSDAIAEADIYVAYGRYQQALTLLASVADNEAHNGSVYAKMVEICLQCDRREEAEGLVSKIEQTHDMNALKRAMDALAAGPVSSESIELGELADAAPGKDAATQASESVQEPAAGLDFELVSSDATDDSELSAAPAFDLELDLSSGSSDSTEPTDNESLTDLSVEAADEVEAAAELPDLGTADWGDLSEPASPSDGLLPPELAAVLGTDVPPPPVDQVERDDDDAIVYAQEADPMDTKLDLARAYIDMGDEDGARPVLEEVIAGGDLQQQAEARELLVRID